MKRSKYIVRVDEDDTSASDSNSGERAWVDTLVKPVETELNRSLRRLGRISVRAGIRLAYTCSIDRYAPDDSHQPELAKYQTDLLVSETFEDNSWTPRVVVECKYGSINTHDALTYSAKAATHKNVHPYLRYGVLIGAHRGKSLPVRLVKHGAHFDFMITWDGSGTQGAEFTRFVDLLAEEIEASRQLQALLASSRTSERKRQYILHRPLRLS